MVFLSSTAGIQLMGLRKCEGELIMPPFSFLGEPFKVLIVTIVQKSRA